jgi:molybdopterin biosynthesis enzyme MoaB
MSKVVPGRFTVRLLALGDEGVRELARVSAAVRAAWGPGRVLDLQAESAGEDAALASRTVKRWCDRDGVDAVLTVGRSGHLRGDFAPGITAPLLERRLPGVEERMHLAPPRRALDLLFRGCAGLRRTTLVVNLPAGAARAGAILRLLAPVLEHALEKARGSDSECGATGKS